MMTELYFEHDMKLLVSMFLLLLTASALANDSAVSTPFKIESLRVSESTGITYINPVGSLAIKNNSCASTDLYAIKQSLDSTTYDAMYSTLLSAAMSDKEIKIWISTVDGDCHNNRQRVSVVEILL